MPGQRTYEEGFNLYQQRDWAGAIAVSVAALDLMPSDKPVAIFLDRCRYYAARRLAGVWIMEGK